MKKFFLLAAFVVICCLSNAQVTELMIKKAEKALYLEHPVAPKEGLYVIGRLYNVNAKSLAAYNHIDFNKGLEINQVLRIPLTDTNFTQRTASGTPVYHKVVSGDGLYKVSNDYNKVALKNLKEWNKLTSDNIQEGADLVIGYLISKELPAYLANNRLKKQELAKQQAELEQAITKDSTTFANATVAAASAAPVTDKPMIKQDKPVTKEDKPVVKTEPIAAANKPVVTDVVLDDAKKEELPTSVPAVIREPINTPSVEMGYFKSFFEQQVKAKPMSKNATVTSGIFKTMSGWQDGKYYLLMDGVSPGTIIKLINPGNNKAVYAKVLGEMNGIRQNQGLDIRISNAAASALQITEQDKFIVKVNY